MRTSTALYPFDVVGDESAADAVAALGVDEVSLAAAYHSVRAVTPRHPSHQVVTAVHSAVYFPPDESRWSGLSLRPSRAEGDGIRDSFAPALASLRDAGLAVNAWVVLAHSCGLGVEQEASCVENAFGDKYPWALCISRSEVVEYAATLAGEVVAGFDLDGVELEACGWYGYDHLSAHDKTHPEMLSEADRYLLSLCFCNSCSTRYAGHGIEAGRLRGLVRDSLRSFDPLPGAGRREPPRPCAADELRMRLGGDLADELLRMRHRVADDLRREVVRAVRQSARDRELTIWLHAQVAPHGTGGNVGVDAVRALGDVDGLLYGVPAEPVAAIEAVVAETAALPGRRIGVVVDVLGPPRDDGTELDAVVGSAASAGATDLHLYHAGLASDRGRRVLAGLVERFGD
jgi:hypothetical protein